MLEKVLVTGGAGFMGSHIVDALIAQNYQVVCVDDLSGGFRKNVNSACEFIELDLRDKIATQVMINRVRPEYIFYLASCAREGASQFQPLCVTERNYLAFMNTLVPAIKYEVKKIIVFSSMAVYGKQLVPFDEMLPRWPEDIYAVNKTAMEESVEILSKVHGFDWVILRPHNVFGERQSMKDKFRNVIAIFMNRLMRNEPIYIYGDGEQKRAFSYISDSIDCYVKCLDPSINKEIINIGGKEAISVNRLAEEVRKYFPRSESEIEYLADRPCEVKYAYSTTQKSEDLLGYKEDCGWQEGIKKMANWAKEVGPCNWVSEKMEIVTDEMPTIWK